jgi:choline-sulfatase
VLNALEESRQLTRTTILYTSDHGDTIGNHGFWTKCTMYEESVAIPMLLSGPKVPAIAG